MALISTYWGPVRPLRHHFRAVSPNVITLKLYLRNRSMLSLSIARKIRARCRSKVSGPGVRERFALKCSGIEGKVALRVLIHGNHWPPWCTEAGLTVRC